MALSRWGFPNDVGLITRTDQFIESLTKINVDTTSIENTFETIINNAINGLDDDVADKVNSTLGEQITEAKNEIIEAMPEGCGCGGNNDINNCCCGATKCDVQNAVTEIKEHIDKTFNGENQTQLFSNINEIYNNILNGD